MNRTKGLEIVGSVGVNTTIDIPRHMVRRSGYTGDKECASFFGTVIAARLTEDNRAMAAIRCELCNHSDWYEIPPQPRT